MYAGRKFGTTALETRNAAFIVRLLNNPANSEVSDSNPRSPGAYEQRLHELIKRFRTAFGAAHVPFIVGQIGQFPDRPWDEHRQQVDAAHQSFARESQTNSLRKIRLIESQRRSNPLHLMFWYIDTAWGDLTMLVVGIFGVSVIVYGVALYFWT